MPAPSSLIFVVIILIWAAYLLQHWIRRREALATARSVDRFSEAMRVLDRRGVIADSGAVAMELDGEQARPALPAVSVKPERISLRAGSLPAARDAAVTTTEEVAVQEKSSIMQAPVQVGNRLMKALGRLDRRKVRGVCLLVSLALLVITTLLAPFGLVPWWSPILMLLVTGGVVAWLRSAALKQQAASGVRRPVAPRPAVRTSAQVGGARRQPLQAPVAPAAVNTVEPVYAPVHEVYDVAPVAASVVEVPQPATGSPWEPVQVPRPTYTMKEEAPRPAPAPAAVTPAYEQMPVEDLPFDGMALDLEDDDVRPVYRAG
ncbi:hypothetical protein [Branchiibius sp. NY16-3462-2]|uniref:hypothetical protein n=1 Tax=Branchiibius sp. NY16-3462-2 TaxID=1807500 RepID=UPI0007970593|nr:hypothetical protein [Branchiibius sp. NY16-3462-2]KYH45643.1 hypothetical protein AZH51_18170 [Branchiibius sp. NY16-3462-2]